MMSCEEFERFGLDLDRPDAQPEEAALASEHAEHCPDCSALLAAWREVKADLHLLRESTIRESAPTRVEMRLKQELRTRRETRVPARTFAIASWALPAAAALTVAVGWMHWHSGVAPAAGDKRVPVAAVTQESSARPNDETLMAADFDPTAFTQLPNSMPSASSDQSVLQVRLQRGALMQYGVAIEPEQASDWVDVDFLVGEDGQPVAVRLHQDAQSDVRPQ
jgi:hypothetical protein